MFSVVGFALGLVVGVTGGAFIGYGLKGFKGDKRLFVVGLGFAALTYGIWIMRYSI